MIDLTFYDLIIIGAGPSGISAALYAQKHNLKFTVIAQKFGGYANLVEEIKQFPGFDYVSGYGLMSGFLDQIKQLNVPLIEEETVVEITKKENRFEIRTTNATYFSRTVIVASGRRFRKPNIRNESRFIGKGISHFSVFDSTSFPNQKIAVVGGGHSGLFCALYAAKVAQKVYLIEKHSKVEETGKTYLIAKQTKKNERIEILTNTEAIEIIGDEEFEGLKIKDEKGIRNLYLDAAIFAIGYSPNTEMVAQSVNLNSKGEIKIDKNNMTNISGLFAAGDVSEVPQKQIIVALGEGAKAALSAINYLNHHHALEEIGLETKAKLNKKKK
ncbi:NAD(P)/FAD-dependent oxidoreductase [Candidatus Micrarchaeota archaeon]|nr:NAD(P)/FAD-dependent oxidoreductase [Candidatus Micrarchaeota archaeon]